MAGAPWTKRRILEAPGTRERVIEAIMRGDTDVAIAKAVGVERPAINQFRRRNREELTALHAKAAALVETVALRDKAERIRRLAWLADGMEAELRVRGFMWTEPFGEKRSVERMPTGAVKELRGVYRDIAEELGQIAPPTVTIQQNLVLIRQVIGVDETVPLG